VLSSGLSTYSAHAPKRLAVLHQHDANAAAAPGAGAGATSGAGAGAAVFYVGAFDSVPAASALPPLLRNAVTRWGGAG
jgi:hypothetical protein